MNTESGDHEHLLAWALIGLERVDANDGDPPPPTVVGSHFLCLAVKHARFLVRLGGPFSRPGLNVASAPRAAAVKHGRSAATGAAGLCLTGASTAPSWSRSGSPSPCAAAEYSASIQSVATLVSPGHIRGAARH
jgi:hypothetical protein